MINKIVYTVAQYAVIVNSEVETAQWLNEIGAAITVPYSDTKLLTARIKDILDGNMSSHDFVERIHKFSRSLSGVL
ncbi:TPA: hypothetical protein ACPJ1T_000937 [Vibrio diabolicus]